MDANLIGKRRSIVVFFSFLIFYLIILFNLYSIQILHRDFFIKLANNQRTVSITSYPKRACIFDRNNKQLTLNRDSIAAFILPHKIEEPEKLKKFLKLNFNSAYKKLSKYNNKYFMYIKRKLSSKNLDLINKAKLKDIKLISEPSRFYLFEATAPVLGLTDVDNKGLFGVEKKYNSRLAGEKTVFDVEKDARSRKLYYKKATKEIGKEGKSVKLTLDSDLQFLVTEELQDTVNKFNALEGSAVVLDPSNGHILAMASVPNFDPNKNYYNLDLSHTKNRAITEAHELGSVMKPFVALAALEEKVVTPEEVIDCESKKEVKLDGFKVSTWQANGELPFIEVISKSNNIGIVKVAKRLDKKLYDHYKKLGFGKKTAVKLSGEQSGLVSHPKNWSKRSIISLSFGYEVSATLLQLASAMGVIANYGYAIQPKLFLEPNINKPELRKRLYSQKSIDQIRSMLKTTVVHGTARRAKIQGYNILGKTGTAKLLVDGKYSDDHSIYSFIGIVEHKNYKRIIALYVKDSSRKNLFAATVAAPLFEKIAEKMIIHDRILN